MHPQNSKIPQPSSSAETTTGMKPATTQNLGKRKTLALVLSIASLVIFIVGLLVGFILPIAAVLGAYGLYIGIRTKTPYLIVLGSIGLAANFILYTLAVILKLSS